MRPYRKEYFEEMDFNRDFLAESIGKPAAELAEIYRKSGPAFAAFFEGKPFAIAGVSILWPGTAEAWAIFGKDFYKHGFFIHRQTLRELPGIAREHKLIRIQASADADQKGAIAWLFALKFELEGKMPFYINRRTHLRFARIFPEV